MADERVHSIRDQMGVAELPLAKDLDEFTFDGTPINGNLVRGPSAAKSSPNSAMSR
jgi:hypothetical protein